MNKFLSSITKSEVFNQISKNPIFIKYYLIIIPGIAITISLVIIILITIPQTYNLLETYKTIDDLKQKEAFYQGKIAGLEQVSEEHYQSDLETALIALPADKDIPGSVSQILSVVGSAGLKLKAISLGNSSTAEGPLSNFIIRLDVEGNYAQVKDFLEQTKKIARLNKLRSISINASINRSELIGEIVLDVYFQPLPQTIGSIDEPLPQITQADLQILEDVKGKIGAIRSESSSSAGPKGKFDPFN